ncbi:MAG: DUF4097 domain-containing protein [Blautia sp.]|nr:DUF4097 domain-containing protein [Blautia sp.]
MKKSVYLTILTVVTVICIIAGSCYHIIGWGVDLMENIFDTPFWSSGEEKQDAGPVITDANGLEDFSAISVDASVMSLTIQPGETASISYKGNKKLAPTYEVSGNELIVTQNAKINKFWGNKKCNVTITVPRDSFYDCIEISSDVGDIDLSRLQGNVLKLETAVGDIDIEDCSFENMEINADVGDVDIEKCSFTTIETNASVGDIDVESAQDLSDYTIDLSTDIGEVSVNDRDYRRSYEQEGVSGKSVSLYNSTGDISLSY